MLWVYQLPERVVVWYVDIYRHYSVVVLFAAHCEYLAELISYDIISYHPLFVISLCNMLLIGVRSDVGFIEFDWKNVR